MIPLSFNPLLSTLKKRLFPKGVSFNDETRRRGLLYGISLVGIFTLILLGSLACIQGGIVLASIDFLVAALLLILLYLLWAKNYLDFCLNCSVALTFLLYLYLFVSGGIGGNAFLWSFTFPLVAFFLLGTQKGFLISVSYYLFCVLIILLDLNTSLAINLYDKNFAFRFLPSFAVVLLFSFIYELFRENSQTALIHLNNNLEQEVNKRTAELKEANGEWERTFDAVPDEMVILDTKHRIVRANKAMQEAAGLPLDTLIHSNCSQSIHGTSESPPYCPLLKVYENQTSQDIEYFNEHTRRYYSVTVSPLYDARDKFIGVVRVARDITEQKKNQIERDNAKERLRKAEKMEALGLMAGGVAHDLNNILSGLVSYPELLLYQLSKGDKYHEHLTLIHESGKRAAAIVDDLLTVARGVATTRVVRSLNSLIREYCNSAEFKNVRSLFPQIELTLALDTELWNIQCSPIHIQKILMNLINNGMEAIESKGRVLVSTSNILVDSENKKLSLHAGKYAILTVQDTGTGIPEENLGRIFEPFYTKKEMGRSGTGLGLAVVWNIIKDHDAEIEVSSGSSGTIFTLYFPASPEKEVLPETKSDIKRLRGTGSVLIVDDEENQRQIATKMLENLGYSIETVSSGEAALAFIRENSVDLILLDMIMEPGMNGRQTYEEIVAIKPTQKAIIASGFSKNKDIDATLTLGAGEFLKKPYSMEQLGRAVQTEMLKT